MIVGSVWKFCPLLVVVVVVLYYIIYIFDCGICGIRRCEITVTKRQTRQNTCHGCGVFEGRKMLTRTRPRDPCGFKNPSRSLTVRARQSHQRVIMTCWWLVSTGRDGKGPPTSPYDSLVPVVVVDCESQGEPPTSHYDLLVVGVEGKGGVGG